jgi:PKD repeat protein
VKLITTNAGGCRDSLIEKNFVTVLGAEPMFKASVTTGCPPLDVSFVNLSINAVSWVWNFGDGSTTADKDPDHVFANPGDYSVSLVTYDSAGCKTVYTMPQNIHVYDHNAPAASPILSLSVVSNSAVDITWDISKADDFKSYILFRENSSGDFTPVKEINDPKQTFFRDENLNTLVNTYTYKLQTVDFCGNALELGQLQAYTTINLQASAAGKNIMLQWSPYKGCDVDSYVVYRMESGMPAVKIAELSGNTLAYLDTTLYCPFNYSYRILAASLCGRSYTSYSDTSIAAPMNVYLVQKVDVVRSTVVDDQGILTEWKEAGMYPDRITGYSVYRSDDNKGFMLLAKLPKEAREYMDNTADIKNTHYYYRVEADNACNVHSGDGDHGVSLLLNASRDNDNNVDLQWNGYDQWPQAPAYYVIEKMNDQGEWEFVKKVDGSVQNYKDKQ